MVEETRQLLTPFVPIKASPNGKVSENHATPWLSEGKASENPITGLSDCASIPCKTYRVTQRFYSVPTTKKRSVFYSLANNELRSIVDLGADTLDFSLVVTHFENWRSHYSDKFIHLYSPYIDKHLFMKSICRFDEGYRSHLRARMRRLKDFNWSIKLEITLDPKQFFHLYDEFIKLGKIWNNINRWLRHNYGDLEFMWVREPSKKGRPHFHILVGFYDIKWQKYFKAMNSHDKRMRFDAFYDEFKAIVSKNGGGFVWVKPIQGHLNLVNYVMKYVNKSISGDEDKMYSALLFASNKRLFSISKGLQVFKNPKKEKQGYEYVACVQERELDYFCKMNGIPLGFSVSVDSNLADPEGYPLVFGGGGG
jgi:hypothetical protein